MKFFLADLKDGAIHHFEEKLNPKELDVEFVDWKYCESLQVSGSIEKLKAEGKLKKKQAMNQCKTCHRNRTAQGLKAGPIKCKDCHNK